MIKPEVKQCRYSLLDIECGYNPYSRNCYGYATSCEGYTTHLTIGEYKTNTTEQGTQSGDKK